MTRARGRWAHHNLRFWPLLNLLQLAGHSAAPHLPAPASIQSSVQQTSLAAFPGYSSQSAAAEMEALKSDMNRVVEMAKHEFAQNMHDVRIQQKLKALLHLNDIVWTRALPIEQIRQIQAQVNGLVPVPPAAVPVPVSTPTPQARNGAPLASLAPQGAPFSLARLVGNARAQSAPAGPAQPLVDLLRGAGVVQPAPTPAAVQTPFAMPAASQPGPSQWMQQLGQQSTAPAASVSTVPLSQLLPQAAAPSAPVGNPAFLLAALQAHDLLNKNGTPRGAAGAASSAQLTAPGGSAARKQNVELTTASMKRLVLQ